MIIIIKKDLSFPSQLSLWLLKPFFFFAPFSKSIALFFYFGLSSRELEYSEMKAQEEENKKRLIYNWKETFSHSLSLLYLLIQVVCMWVCGRFLVLVERLTFN